MPGSPPHLDSVPVATGADRLTALLAREKVFGLRLVAWIVAAGLALFVAWASQARLDEVSVAPGEVAPRGKVKVVQHLEGGMVTEIFVTEGQRVQPDQPLMQLDLGLTGVNQEELNVRLDGLKLARIRLLSEAEGSPLAFPPDLAAARPQLVEAERATNQARLQELRATQAVLREQVTQKTNEIAELETRERSTVRNLGLASERVNMSASLLAQQLTARMDHVERLADQQRLQGDLDSVRAALPRARSALSEVQKRLEESEASFRREARERLGQTELELARQTQLLTQASDQARRTEIRSPIEGIVKNMRLNTIGGVVRAGEPILDLVPARDDLVVEARLNPADRGYVREGQTAVIKVSTYDYARYGGLQGTVSLVAPDSTVPEKDAPFFRVVVTPAKTYLGAAPGDLDISPGMQATVDIHTGNRTILDYLITPVIKLRAEAFRER